MQDKEWIKISEALWFQEGPGVRNTQYTDSGVKLLNVANLVDGKVDLSTSDRYISEEEAYGKYKHFLCDEGDFIIASSGIKVEYIDKKMGFITKDMLPLCMNTSTIRFKVIDKDKLNIKYFMYYLKSFHFKQQLAKQITGSAQLNYGPSHLSKMIMPMIDINEQNTIVNNLSKIEQLIENQNKKLNYLDELVKARFVEMFGNLEENNHNYETGLVKDYCTMTQGVQIPMSEQIDHIKEGYNRYLYIQDLKYEKNEKLFVLDIYPEKILTTNDLVVVNTGNGSGEIYMGKDGILSNNLFKVSYDTTKFNPVYMYYYFSSDVFQNWLWSEMKEGTQPHLGHKIFGNKRLLVPDIKLQNKFSEFVQQIDKLKFVVQQKVKYYRELQDKLMKEYFG